VIFKDSKEKHVLLFTSASATLVKFSQCVK